MPCPVLTYGFARRCPVLRCDVATPCPVLRGDVSSAAIQLAMRCGCAGTNFILKNGAPVPVPELSVVDGGRSGLIGGVYVEAQHRKQHDTEKHHRAASYSSIIYYHDTITAYTRDGVAESTYRHSTRCTALTGRDVLPAPRVTRIYWVASHLWSYALARQCPVLAWAMLLVRIFGGVRRLSSTSHVSQVRNQVLSAAISVLSVPQALGSAFDFAAAWLHALCGTGIVCALRAMCGTERGIVLCEVGTQILRQETVLRDVRCCEWYRATLCPVLRKAALQTEMQETAFLVGMLRASVVPEPTERYAATSLRACYAKSGTDLAYGSRREDLELELIDLIDR
eukprot:3221838-Rhodomonas_salina.2